MFLILSYDIASNQKNRNRVHKLCRRFLHRVHYSVFEGELTKAQIEMLKMSLSAIIDGNRDSVLLYGCRSRKYIERMALGKGLDQNFGPLFL